RRSSDLLPGVSVMVKNQTSIGTTTDLNGRYVLATEANATLMFSMVGYEAQEINISGKEVINVSLTESASAMDEVVVTAFGGVQKRTDMIGSVVSIKPSELKI